MKISDLNIGDFYMIKPTTKKKVVVNKSSVGLKLSLADSVADEIKVFKESYF
tara:strand:- start:488 stop:643 length:156 start_codon:yes stop_codon:yes gene_type:complete